MGALRNFLTDFRPHQRSYCYLNGIKVGYAIPMRDSMFQRAWSWVAMDMNGNTLGVTTSLAESKTLCFMRASDKLRSYVPRLASLD